MTVGEARQHFHQTKLCARPNAGSITHPMLRKQYISRVSCPNLVVRACLCSWPTIYIKRLLLDYPMRTISRTHSTGPLLTTQDCDVRANASITRRCDLARSNALTGHWWTFRVELPSSSPSQ